MRRVLGTALAVADRKVDLARRTFFWLDFGTSLLASQAMREIR